MRFLWRILLFFLCVTCVLSASCSLSNRKKIDYYSDKDNYITVEGIIYQISYGKEDSILYLTFSDMSEKLSDRNFKIVGESYQKVLSDNGKELIQVGKKAVFVTAPKIFGDGYVMPIVALYIDDQCLLESEAGISNLLDWLKN